MTKNRYFVVTTLCTIVKWNFNTSTITTTENYSEKQRFFALWKTLSILECYPGRSHMTSLSRPGVTMAVVPGPHIANSQWSCFVCLTAMIHRCIRWRLCVTLPQCHCPLAWFWCEMPDSDNGSLFGWDETVFIFARTPKRRGLPSVLWFGEHWRLGLILSSKSMTSMTLVPMLTYMMNPSNGPGSCAPELSAPNQNHNRETGTGEGHYQKVEPPRIYNLTQFWNIWIFLLNENRLWF